MGGQKIEVCRKLIKIRKMALEVNKKRRIQSKYH
jgi:hypothetical protein